MGCRMRGGTTGSGPKEDAARLTNTPVDYSTRHRTNAVRQSGATHIQLGEYGLPRRRDEGIGAPQPRQPALDVQRRTRGTVQ